MSVESQNEPEREAYSVFPLDEAALPPVSPPRPEQSAERHTASTVVHSYHTEFPRLILAAAIVLATALMLALHLQSFLGDSKFRGILVSEGLRKDITEALPRDPPLLVLFEGAAVAALCLWIAGALVLALLSWTPLRTMLWRWGLRFLWLWILGLFELLWGSGDVLWPGHTVEWLTILVAAMPFFHTFAWGGLLAGAIGLVLAPDRAHRIRRALGHPGVVWFAAAVYVVVFSTLSILQYRALMVPHGDTAMYEEHLWNLLHGKGFRSQLDDGRLFFGEHLEVIHVLLLPVYVLFPCLPTLNICLTVGLASGAIAVRGITHRITGSAGAANWLGVAYLLYFPLQYLNLEASLKTLRPENLGVPLLLFAIWCLEANRLRTMLILMGLTLLAKEDYAIPIGMIGLFLAVRRGAIAPTRASRWLGVGVLSFSICFLWFVLAGFIPYFRGGPPHYTAYFRNLGDTPTEILLNLVRNPGTVVGDTANERLTNLVYLLSLTLTLGGLPLLGIGRLWVLLPTLASLTASRLDGTHSLLFHFHAPLVPVVFWAAAEGVARLGRWSGLRESGIEDRGSGVATDNAPTSPDNNAPSFILRTPWPLTRLALFAATCALASGIWSGKSPISFAFYDSHSDIRGFGRLLYVPSDMALARVQGFEQLFPLIPADAVVAATDYVRPRFTHHRECHQYGAGGLKPNVNPDSIDYIVVDLLGPFSDWAQGHRLREVEEQPDRWEVFHWDPLGELFFHVVRAKREGTRPESNEAEAGQGRGGDGEQGVQESGSPVR